MNNSKRNSFTQIAVRSVDEDNYRITHSINTKALDRYDTVVLPKGSDTKNFLNNSVVLWVHNGDSSTATIPIARCVSLEVNESEIVAVTEFNRNDPFAVKVFNAYKDGFLNAWSIGFIPKGYKHVDTENFEDINEKYSLSFTLEQIQEAERGWGIYLIYEWELLEYSAVPIPGNPECLTKAEETSFKRELVTRGLLDEKLVSNMDIRAILAKREEESKEKTSEETPKEDETSINKDENTAEEKPALTLETEPEKLETPSQEKPETPSQEKPETPENTEPTDDENTVDTLNAEAQERIAELEKVNAALLERLVKLEQNIKEVETNLSVNNIDNIRAIAQKKLASNPDTFFSRLLGR